MTILNQYNELLKIIGETKVVWRMEHEQRAIVFKKKEELISMEDDDHKDQGT